MRWTWSAFLATFIALFNNWILVSIDSANLEYSISSVGVMLFNTFFNRLAASITFLLSLYLLLSKLSNKVSASFLTLL